MDNILTVKKNTEDLTNKAYLFENENISLTLTTDDFLYVSFKKPINQFYADFQAGNTNAATLSAERLTEANTWVLMGIVDETQGFKRSGFVYLKNEGSSSYRFKLSSNSSALKLRGIANQFCSELDLKLEVPGIERLYARGWDSPIPSIEQATRKIVQDVNNSGRYYKYNGILAELVNRYDFLNINDVRNAAKYYALHLLFLNLSDSDDNYRHKAEVFYKKFEDAFKVFSGAKLSIDKNEDGKEDPDDQNISTYEFKR